MTPWLHLWDRIVDWGNLLRAYQKARRGKSSRGPVRRFGLDLEWELAEIRQDLLQRTYRPGAFRQFHVKDRKIRLISAAPFRDRVVQHAVMNIVEPLIDRRFIFDSYASRRGKGVHKAVYRYQQWARLYRFAAKLDVSRYFDSIDHARLKQKIGRHIGDPQVRWLFDETIDHGPPPSAPHLIRLPDEDLVDMMLRPCGLPLGNLTSQFFGNLYLNDLDHYVKEQLRVPAYLRYVDDLILLANDKSALHAWCGAIEAFLATERLAIHPRKRQIYPVAAGQDILGYRVFPNRIELSRGSGYCFRRSLKRMAVAYSDGEIELSDVKCRISGWLGHARQADSLGLQKAILSRVYFRKGDRAGRSPGGSGRFVEQQPTEPSIGQPQQEQAG